MEGNDQYSNRELVFSFASGFLLVVFLVVFGLVVEQRIGEIRDRSFTAIQVINFLDPLTFSLAGLAIGHYAGKAHESDATDLDVFYLGSFLAVMGALFLFLSSENLPLTSLTSPVVFVPVCAFLAVALNVSGLVRNYEVFGVITEWFFEKFSVVYWYRS